MSKVEKNNQQEITQQEKNDFKKLKKLLEDMALSIKKEENLSEKLSHETTDVDEKIWKLSSKIESLSTQKEASDFLNEIQSELWALKEYSELEKKVDELKDKYSQNVKTKLTYLQKDIFDKNNLTKEQLLIKSIKWRKKSAEKIWEWIVSKLAQRNDWIWKIARKANS